MRPPQRGARLRSLLRRGARATGRTVTEGLFWLGLTLGPVTPPSSMPGLNEPRTGRPRPAGKSGAAGVGAGDDETGGACSAHVPPVWHPEFSGPASAPPDAEEAALWAQLED